MKNTGIPKHVFIAANAIIVEHGHLAIDHLVEELRQALATRDYQKRNAVLELIQALSYLRQVPEMIRNLEAFS